MHKTLQEAPLLTAERVRLQQGGREILALESLSLAAGQVWHLQGENGVGKTTLLRALAGEQAYTGQIRIMSQVPGTVQARAITAFVPTEPLLIEDLRVQEYLDFVAAMWSRPAQPLLALAERFGLAEWFSAWPSELSRGSRQKVALSAALGLGLPLTLLDEPFSPLDQSSRRVLSEALSARAAAGGLLLVSTHGPELERCRYGVLQLQDGGLIVEQQSLKQP